MALKVKVGGEVGYFDCRNIVELATRFALDHFRRGHVELRFTDTSRGLVQTPFLHSNNMER